MSRRFALVVAQFPLPLPAPDGEDYFAEPGRLMAKEGFEVDVLTARRPGQSALETVDGFTVRRFDSLRSWVSAVRAGHYDLIHAHSQLRAPMLTGLVGGAAKTVFTSHTFVLPLSAWKRRLLIALMNRFDRVVAFTPFERDVFVESGVAESRVTVVPLAINVRFFESGGDATRFRAKWGIAPDAPIILFVANVQRRKNPEVILRAIVRVRKEAPTAKLVVVGRDMLPDQGEPSLHELARRCGVEEGVVCTDWLGGEPLRDAIAASSVAINSSGPRSFENFPLAIMEAAAASKALCLPTLGSLQSVFGNDALYHEPTDDETLAKNILRYLHDGNLRHSHGTACRARVEEFDLPTANKRLLEVYRAALGG